MLHLKEIGWHWIKKKKIQHWLSTRDSPKGERHPYIQRGEKRYTMQMGNKNEQK